jgi:hypothetical protein
LGDRTIRLILLPLRRFQLLFTQLPISLAEFVAGCGDKAFHAGGYGAFVANATRLAVVTGEMKPTAFVRI